MKISLKNLFIFSLLCYLSGCYLYSKNYKYSDITVKEVFDFPKQTPLGENDKIQDCCKGKRCWDFEPVARYEITAFVFGHSNRTLADFSEIITDLGLLWGENASKKYYKDVDLKVLLSAYYVRWGEGENFNLYHAANNHMITCDNKAYKKLRTIKTGDQVRLKGYLVDAKISDKPYEKDPLKIMEWKTSRTREDTGGNSCELFYVNSADDIEILAKGPRHWLYLKYFGLCSLIAVIIFWAYNFNKKTKAELAEAQRNTF